MLITWIAAAAAAQPDPALLTDVHDRSVRTDTVGLGVLGAWSVLNIAGGITGSLLAEDPTWKGFHQANAGWNMVNLAIAGAGLYGARQKASRSPVWPGLSVELANQRSVLLLNLGLDVAYVTAGAALWQQPDPTRQGYGQALVLQGGFLGAFDLTMTLLNASNASRLRPYYTGESVGVTLVR